MLPGNDAMTILYERDWDRFPTAIPDFETKNHTWAMQAAKYHQMGVKNYYFFLALYNPLLVGVDPYSPNLTEEQKQMILLECAWNPWYVIREVIRIPEGKDLNMVRANRGNIAMFWCVLNSFITYVQQIRQTGKSLNTRVIVVLFHMFMAKGAEHILFTKGDLRKGEIKHYKKMRESLPKWMWKLTSKDTDNQYEFTNMENGNITYSYVPQGDPEAANTVGRGKTPKLITNDETPFCPYASISIPALIASTTNSFDEAKAKKQFHAILYTTTAGDLSTESGKYVYEKIKKMGMFFSEILFDQYDRDGAIDVIVANSLSKDRGAPYVDISFNHLQLGYSDDWLRSKIATVPGSRDQIKRDFLGQWTFGSTANPIPEKIMNVIRDNANQWPVVVKDEKTSYIVKYHLPVEEVKRRVSVMGLDMSNAVNRDAITGVMLDVETSETLATFMIGEANLVRFAQWLARFIQAHPKMTLIPEHRSSWISVLDSLIIDLPMMGIDPGRRIYSRIVDSAGGADSDKRTYRDYCYGVATESKYFQYRNDFGFPTSGPLRESLYTSVMKDATQTAAKLVRDATLIDELSSLVEKNGRIDHKSSGHDDHVISWLMAHWFLRWARNQDHYGIDKSTLLSKVRASTVGNDPKKVRQILKEEKLSSEIELWEAKLANASGMMEEKYIKAKIASLKSQVRGDDGTEDVGSIDKVSEAAKEKRKEARQQDTRHYRDGYFTGRLQFNIRPR